MVARQLFVFFVIAVFSLGLASLSVSPGKISSIYMSNARD
jgi:uncharacterized membrane-anchored protein